MFINTNTRLVSPEFDYLQPKTLAEAFSMLDEHGTSAKLLAGGTDLLVQMKMERQQPSHVISLSRVKELDGIKSGNGLTIGAMTSIRSVSRSEPVKADYAALQEACNAYSTVSVMLMGTLGGNICNASPAADTAPALMVFDASAVLKSAKGARKVLLREFFTGPGKTVMQPGEILTAIELPKPVRGTGSAFMKISRVVADISQVCVAVVLVRDGDKITDCRIALGSVGPTPVRMKHAVSALIGQRGTAEAFAAAADIVSKDITPITDVRATEKYRRHVARIIVRDALQKAWLRAAEGAAK